jgi:hypothetical protein
MRYNHSKALRPSFLRALLVLLVIMVGLAGPAISQRIETRTSTVVTTLPPKTITTTIVSEGVVVTATIQFPDFVVIQYVDESGRTCTVVFRAFRESPETVISFQGTTISVPGGTFSTVINQATYVTSLVETSAGWTTTYTGLGPGVRTTISIGQLVTTMEIPAYGELREVCGPETIRQIMTIILERAPATLLIAFPGLTMTIPGVTYTVPGMTLGIEEFTTTYTSVLEGATYTTTYTVTGTTMQSTVQMPSTSYVTTVISPGGVATVYVVYTTTLAEETTPTTTETTRLTEATTTPATTAAPTTTAPPPVTRAITTEVGAAQPIDPLVLAVVGVAIAVVVVAVFFALRRGR